MVLSRDAGFKSTYEAFTFFPTTFHWSLNMYEQQPPLYFKVFDKGSTNTLILYRPNCHVGYLSCCCVADYLLSLN